MADKSIVSNLKLKAIANAIREKTGTKKSLTLDNMANEIKNIAAGEGGGTTSDVILGNKLYRFGVLSDIHLRIDNFKNGIDDFNRAIEKLQEKDVEFVCISGDLGHSNTTDELELYKDAIDAYAKVPYYICTGNHDTAHSDEDWEFYTGCKKNFEFFHNGDVFLFMSLETSSSSSSGTTPYGNNLVWLKERISLYTGARMFVFLHFPLSGYSGLVDGQYYGFSSDSIEDDTLLTSFINAKNVICFSGHTHYKFDVEQDYDSINIFRFENREVTLMHVPSCAYPRKSSGVEDPDLSEGFIVDVYENGVVIDGIDLTTGNYMENYKYILTTVNNPVAIQNAIILSYSEIELEAGQSTEVYVKLSQPANATVNIVCSNDKVTVEPTSLTFTEMNYSDYQTIVVTATSSFSESGSALITLSSEGFTDKIISVSAYVEYTEITNASQLPIDGAIYSGTYSGTSYQLKSTVAATYNLTFKNLSITATQTPLYISNASAVLNVNLQGVNNLISTQTGGQRAMSSSATTPCEIKGIGLGAELHLSTNSESTSAALKGDYNITNAYIDVTTAVLPLAKIEKGITLVNHGIFEVNKAKVELLEASNGILSVNLDVATPGTSAITITGTANDGYTLSNVLVNGLETSIDGLIMPDVNTTMTIQGVFTKS